MAGYTMRFRGQQFAAELDDTTPATTLAPNVHVISGPWPTWRIETTPGPPLEVRIRRCLSPADPELPHPAGNLSFAASDTDGHVLVLGGDGQLQRAPIGWVILGGIPEGAP